MKHYKILIKLLFGVIPLFVLFGLFGWHGCTSEGRDSGGTIWGTIRAANNPDRGVSNALISLDDRNIFAVTSGTGYFSIMGVPRGQYNVKITKFGHEIFRGSAFIDRGLTVNSPDNQQYRFSEYSYMVQFPTAGPGDKMLAATLLDTDGKPIVGAEVDLIYRELGNFFVTDSDIAGSFYFEGIPEKPDLMLIDAEGFKPAVFSSETIESFMNAGSQGALVNLIPLERDLPSESSTSGKVAGTIHDSSENLVAGIKVALIPYSTEINPIDSVARVRTTNGNGKFEFANLEPAEYIVWAGGPNHFPLEKKVKLSAGESITIDLVLQEATNREMHPIFKGWMMQ